MNLDELKDLDKEALIAFCRSVLAELEGEGGEDQESQEGEAGQNDEGEAGAHRGDAGAHEGSTQYVFIGPNDQAWPEVERHITAREANRSPERRRLMPKRCLERGSRAARNCPAGTVRCRGG